jgi:hypothetical protein
MSEDQPKSKKVKITKPEQIAGKIRKKIVRRACCR